MKEFKRAIELDPNYDYGRYYLATSLLKTGSVREARQMLLELDSKSLNEPGIHYRLG